MKKETATAVAEAGRIEIRTGIGKVFARTMQVLFFVFLVLPIVLFVALLPIMFIVSLVTK